MAATLDGVREKLLVTRSWIAASADYQRLTNILADVDELIAAATPDPEEEVADEPTPPSGG